MGQNFSQVEKKAKRGLRPFFGLLMAIALGVIAYVLAPVLFNFVDSRSPNFSIGNLSKDQVLLLFAAIIFFVLLGIFTLILGLTVPKKKSEVLDAALVKERKAMEAERRAKKKRQLEIARKLREQNKRLE
jgi:uncharacterized membrane protein HdeD (DUF308 family)